MIPRPPRAITFDCWSTLISDIDWGATVVGRRDALLRIAAGHGVHLDPEKAMELIEGSWREHVAAWRRGEGYGPKAAARWVLDQIAAEAGDSPAHIDDELADQIAEGIGSATSEVGTNVVPGAPEVLEQIRQAGIPTALICDTGFTPGARVREFLEGHSIRLDHYFFSDEFGVPKPLRPIFDAALEATGAEAASAVHIGDLRRTDVAGARGAGMATIRFAGVHDDGWEIEESTGEEADAVIRSWAELPALVGI
ncbi:MAG TPA: HAD family hydrolase [Actinomycetota bacterium]|nr:HAD family hydrolase [Actinomycetota bacterium]